MVDVNRRSFLRGVLTVSALSVVPVALVKIAAPLLPRIYSDGIHCDSDGLAAALARQPFTCDTGAEWCLKIADDFLKLQHGNFLVDRPIAIGDFQEARISDCTIVAAPNFKGEAMLSFKRMSPKSRSWIENVVVRGPTNGLASMMRISDEAVRTIRSTYGAG